VGGSPGFSFKTATGGIGHRLTINPGAFGAGAQTGAALIISRNTSGGGAPGVLGLADKSGAQWWQWADTTGLLRTASAVPEEDGTPADTSGTVIGDQTSKRDQKFIISERVDHDYCLETILNAPVFDFIYRDGRYNGQKFTGITTDDSPVFGKDNGKSLNEITLFGYLINAMKAQQQQIEDLRCEVEKLKLRVE
jgi:hypothetical protein